MNSNKHEKDYLDKYEKEGYTASYRVDKGKLIEVESKSSYKPEDVTIVAEHRFEGMTNPSDLSILYVIETSDNKGTILTAYGPEANIETAEFFKEIPESNISKN